MKDTLIRVLNGAGDIQRRKFRKALQVSIKKADNSVVTEVDTACEQLIFDTIRQAFPEHNLLGEESGFVDNGSGYTWIVDPLDGTSNFAAGIPWFGILIALLEKDTPVMAGSLLPLENSLCFAARGEGTWINGKRITLPVKELSSSLVAFSMDYTEDERLLAMGMTYYRFFLHHARNIRSTNSLIDFQYVTEGKLGACVNFFTRIWDIAASWLFLKESGGLMVGPDGKEVRFDLSQEGIRKTYPVIAGSPGILEQMGPLFTGPLT